MKVKIFTATNMQDALAQVKNDLGRDAIILHSRRFRKGGFLGFFSKEMVEVMAALETPVAAVVEKNPLLPHLLSCLHNALWRKKPKILPFN